jgi:hypothetical protein
MKIERAARLAVDNVLKEGLTDIFPRPHEIALLKNKEFQKRVKAEVFRAISGGSLDSLRIFPLEHVLLPKTSAFDFRRCALIQPLDTIKYLTLAILFAEEIESHRPPKSRKIVFSYRFAPSKGYLFEPAYSFTAFSHYVANKAKHQKTKALVSCDIGNFYDRLNLHRLESILLSLKLDKKYVRLMTQLLLFWADRDSYGLPVGSNASRILAEASLIEVDNYLISIGASFCRFVDDYRLFAPDAHTAHHWLGQLIERLWLEGLTINKSKTKIEDVSDRKKEPKKVSDQGRKPQAEHESTSTSETRSENKQPFRIIAGYGGTIPTKFRKPNASEIERLSKADASDLLSKIKTSSLADPEDVHEFLRSALYGKKPQLFQEIPTVLEKFPQFTPYVVDMLVKHRDEIPDPIRTSLKSSFASQLVSGKYLPEYLAIALIRLLGTEGFQDGSALFDHFRVLRRNAGAYIGRALLDSLQDLVSRGQVLEIRRYFLRADSWEKRQIVRIVDMHLHEEEKRPWLKNVKVQEASDLFLAEYVSPTNKERKGKRKRR